ncbi:hypothetical protein OROHE_019537 [Orobanche hederae]
MEEILAREKVISSNEYIVGSVPTVFYIPDYIAAAEENQLLNNIYQAPISKWKSVKNRRLQNWDLPPWLKKFTCRIYEESKLFLSPINHVLINEYLPDQGIMAHQDGPAYVPVVAILSLGSPVVMEFAPHSRFENAGNSNGDTVSDERLREYLPFSVALMPRSLLIFKDEAYSDYLHGIKDCVDQRYNEAVNITSVVNNNGESGCDDAVIHRTKTRVSLTCRIVKKVHKNLIKF